MIKGQQRPTLLRITTERQAHGWSQAELARRARIDQATQSRIEHGRVRPYPVELRRLARALGFAVKDADQLLDRVHNHELSFAEGSMESRGGIPGPAIGGRAPDAGEPLDMAKGRKP
jgi:transcriptional regulator with XRE-family HTH domain